jgi:hypothetical protein
MKELQLFPVLLFRGGTEWASWGKKRQNWSRSLRLVKPLAMGFSRIRPTLHLMRALIRVKSFALGALSYTEKVGASNQTNIVNFMYIYAQPRSRISSTTLDNPTMWLIKSL